MSENNSSSPVPQESPFSNEELEKQNKAIDELYNKVNDRPVSPSCIRSEKSKCSWIIYNLLRIHNDTTLNHPQTYVKEFFQTTRCDGPEGPFNNKRYTRVSERLHNCRKRYVEKLPEHTLKKILGSRLLTPAEHQLTKDIAIHYYEWNRDELAGALRCLDWGKYSFYLVQYPPNTASVGAAALFISMILVKKGGLIMCCKKIFQFVYFSKPYISNFYNKLRSLGENLRKKG